MAKILVAGSNKDGNDVAKEQAINKLRKAGHKVWHTCDVYRSNGRGKSGDDAVTKKLKECDIYYIVASNGYAGHATVVRLGIAATHPTVTPYSSQLLSKDLVNHVENVMSVEDLIAFLELSN